MKPSREKVENSSKTTTLLYELQCSFCPNCGSRKVEPDRHHTNILGEMMFNPDKWYCKECGYAGIMPTDEDIDTEEKEDIDFEPRKNKKIDTDARKAYTKFYLILIILGLIYTTILLLK